MQAPVTATGVARMLLWKSRLAAPCAVRHSRTVLKGAATFGEAGLAGGGAASPACPPLVLSIIGTRPEAIKMAPVADAIGACAGLRQIILLTGQHDGLASAFRAHDCRRLDVPPLASLEYGEQLDLLRGAIRSLLAQIGPDLVLVHGDTTSALAGAQAAHALGIPIGHVEAGLRTHDPAQPWPEEGHRVAIDAIADLLFAPTATSAANLAREPAVTGRVIVTGNSGIDALHRACRNPAAPLPSGPRKRILVTCHRRENQGDSFAAVCTGLRRLVDELPVELLYLLHTNPHLRAAAKAELAGVEHISLHDAVSHDGAVALMRSAWALLTDSGGLQEDGAALGVPVIVLRDVTERVEAPDNIVLAGSDPDRIVECVNDLLMSSTYYGRMSSPSLAFGDGHAGPCIAAAIETWFDEIRMQPPAGLVV